MSVIPLQSVSLIRLKYDANAGKTHTVFMLPCEVELAIDHTDQRASVRPVGPKKKEAFHFLNGPATAETFAKWRCVLDCIHAAIDEAERLSGLAPKLPDDNG